jgi:hypothetical protein
MTRGSVLALTAAFALCACGGAGTASPVAPPIAPPADAAAVLAPEAAADPRALLLGALERMARGEEVLAEVEALPDAAGVLLSIAADPESPVRRQAIALLGDVRSPDAVPLLSGLADDEQVDGALRLLAAVSLSKYDAGLAAFVLLRARARLVAEGGDPGARETLDQYFFRLGLTDEIGLCPPPGRVVFGPRGRPLGSAHPTRACEVDERRRWAVICQARGGGDRMQPYLVIGSGQGQPIDEYFGRDRSGRHVLVRRGLCVGVIDVVKHVEMALPDADLRPREGIVVFSSDGHEVRFIRAGRGIVKDLESGQETTIGLDGVGHLDASSWQHGPCDAGDASRDLVDAHGGSAWQGVVDGPVRFKGP